MAAAPRSAGGERHELDAEPFAYPGRTLIARASTRTAVTSDTAAWTSNVILAHLLTGSVSVGLNAVALVNDRYR
jgi:hypothetical protein